MFYVMIAFICLMSSFREQSYFFPLSKFLNCVSSVGVFVEIGSNRSLWIFGLWTLFTIKEKFLFTISKFSIKHPISDEICCTISCTVLLTDVKTFQEFSVLFNMAPTVSIMEINSCCYISSVFWEWLLQRHEFH